MAHHRIFLAIIIFLGIIVPIINISAATTEVTYPEIASGVITPATTRTLLPIYMRYIFSALVVLSGVIAFGSGAYAGVRIAMSAGDPSAYGDAKDQLFAAGLGIAFTLGAVVILNTVNPQIVTIRPYTEMDLGIILDKDPACKNAIDVTNDPFLLSERDPYIMKISKSNPFLIPFEAKCLMFISTDSGTLEAKIYSGINYLDTVGGPYSNNASARAIFPLPFIPKSISFVWKIAGVYLIDILGQEKYVPESTGVLGDFNDAAVKIRFRSTIPATAPDSVHFGAVLHESENWSKRCKVYVTDGSLSGSMSWITRVPESTPFDLIGTALSTSSVTTFNPGTAGSADGVTFCIDDNFGGTCYGPYRTRRSNVTVAGKSEADAPGSSGFVNDIITSIRIEGSYMAVLFEHENADGWCEVFTKSDANLRDNPMGRCYCGPFGWGCKDCLSSFIIIPTGSSGSSAVVPPPAPAPPPAAACNTGPKGNGCLAAGYCDSGCASAGFICDPAIPAGQPGFASCSDTLSCGCARTATGTVCTSSCTSPALGGTAGLTGCTSNNACLCTCTGSPTATCQAPYCAHAGAGCSSATLSTFCW